MRRLENIDPASPGEFSLGFDCTGSTVLAERSPLFLNFNAAQMTSSFMRTSPVRRRRLQPTRDTKWRGLGFTFLSSSDSRKCIEEVSMNLHPPWKPPKVRDDMDKTLNGERFPTSTNIDTPYIEVVTAPFPGCRDSAAIGLREYLSPPTRVVHSVRSLRIIIIVVGW